MNKPWIVLYLFPILIVLSSFEIGEDGKKLKAVNPYLGISNLNGGLIKKQIFDSLIKQGLTAKDSLGKPCKVLGFTFSYGERNIYEDANGRPTVMTDYLSEYCIGDTLSTAFQNFVFKDNRTKHGDTLYFDHIKIRDTKGVISINNKMRFILTK